MPENQKPLDEMFEDLGDEFGKLDDSLRNVFDLLKQNMDKFIQDVNDNQAAMFEQVRMSQENMPDTPRTPLSMIANTMLESVQNVLIVTSSVLSAVQSQFNNLNNNEQNREQLSLMNTGNKSQSFNPTPVMNQKSELEKALSDVADHLNNIALAVKAMFDKVKSDVSEQIAEATQNIKQQLGMRPTPQGNAPQNQAKNDPNQKHQQHQQNKYVELMKDSLMQIMKKALDGINNALTQALNSVHQMQYTLAQSNNPDKNQAEQNTIQQEQNNTAALDNSKRQEAKPRPDQDAENTVQSNWNKSASIDGPKPSGSRKLEIGSHRDAANTAAQNETAQVEQQSEQQKQKDEQISEEIKRDQEYQGVVQAEDIEQDEVIAAENAEDDAVIYSEENNQQDSITAATEDQSMFNMTAMNETETTSSAIEEFEEFDLETNYEDETASSESSEHAEETAEIAEELSSVAMTL